MLRQFIKTHLVAAIVSLVVIAIPSLCKAQLTLTEYPVPTGGPIGITAGPDGNLWYTTQDHPGGTIGRITTAGAITEFTVPTIGSVPAQIAAGPDGNLWFSEAYGQKIGRITIGGVFTEFLVPTAVSLPNGITNGPDGNLWFTEYTGHKIGKITTAGIISEFPTPTAGSQPVVIITGPDGNLWFTELLGNKIGMITTAGVITEFPLPAGGNPLGITIGPDGNLWFTEAAGNRIGRITTGGVITEFLVPTANTEPRGITTGPDGNLWFTEDGGGQLGRITTAGVITEYPLPTRNCRPQFITLGSDGNLWFTEYTGNKIGKITFNKPPFAKCKDITVSTDPGQCSAKVVAGQIDNGSYDPDGDPITLTLSPAGPYPVGATTVTLTVSDSNGDKASCKAVITVKDTEPPVITCPANVSVNNDPGKCAAVVNPGTAAATDNCTASPAITSVRSDGKPLNDPYPVGTTTITWTATDAAGNSSSCAETVTVKDNEPPKVSCSLTPVKNGDEDDENKAIFTVQFSATDNCGIKSLTAFIVGIDKKTGASHQIAVTNGQIIHLQKSRKWATRIKHGVLRVRGTDLKLVVTAVDVSGNSAQCISVPVLKGSDDSGDVDGPEGD